MWPCLGESRERSRLPLFPSQHEEKKNILSGCELGLAMCRLWSNVAVGCADAFVVMVGPVEKVHFRMFVIVRVLDASMPWMGHVVD